MSRTTRACQNAIYVGQTPTPFITREDSSYWHMKYIHSKFYDTGPALNQQRQCHRYEPRALL
jgi:hypothetical protein